MEMFNLYYLIVFAVRNSDLVKCINMVDFPLINNVDAPLKASLDITSLNKQIISLIQDEVKEAVQIATEEIVTKISERKLNESIEILDLKISQAIFDLTHNTNVALTVCRSSNGAVSENNILKFPKIITQVGISNQVMTQFISTGRFVCKNEGLYQVSVVLAAETVDGFFDVRKNGAKVQRLLMGNKITGYRTVTTVFLIQLAIEDSVSITLGRSDYVYDSSSCLTILRIK